MTIQPITYDLLRAKGASPVQLKSFRDAFGETTPLTVEAAIEHTHAINWDWAARHLLPNSTRDAYEKAIAPANADYNKARASAWDAYDKATASALDAYDKALFSARDDYAKAVAPALDAYDKALFSARAAYRKEMAPAWDAYNKARAEAFARVYLSQENDQ